jgi:hypothetical protein
MLKRLRTYWFGYNETELAERRQARAAILPTPDSGSVPNPVDPEANRLAPMKNSSHPFQDNNYSLHQHSGAVINGNNEIGDGP